MKFPTKKEIKKVLDTLTDEDASYLLDDDASEVDKIKFSLCKRFIIYLQKHKMTQVELARLLEVDKSRINWIVKYRIEHFSIDYLYTLLIKLEPTTRLKISKK